MHGHSHGCTAAEKSQCFWLMRACLTCTGSSVLLQPYVL